MHMYEGKKSIGRKKRKIFFLLDRNYVSLTEKSIGYGLLVVLLVLWAIDSCDVYTRLENLLPLHELRAARPEARRVTEWRVDLRTPTRVRFLASFAPQAPHHWCTPARHSIALGSLHTLSRRAARTRLYAHHAYSLLRKDYPRGLSSAGFLSTLSSFSRDQLFAQLHHFFPWHALETS